MWLIWYECVKTVYNTNTPVEQCALMHVFSGNGHWCAHIGASALIRTNTGYNSFQEYEGIVVNMV